MYQTTKVMMQIQRFLFIVLVGSVVLLSCKKIFPEAPSELEVLDGPLEGLSPEESKIFLRGEVAFKEVFTEATGLGSTFVSNSCIACHAGDGKGHPSTTLVRFGQPDENGNLFLNQGGPQLQNRALPGFTPESIPAGATFAKFMPPANTGLGFLDFVTDADILAMADPNDADGDGISGIPNWITLPAYVQLRPGTIEQSGKYICRFGKKAAAYDLHHQTVNAYNQDMGIASAYFPTDVYSGLNIEPEISEQKVQDVVFYLRALKAPGQRDATNEEVIKGKQIFNQLNCVACHRSELKTGPSHIKALAYKTFYPYTDLLLHDMGSELDDHYTEGSAKTSEWRTPPLWGLGLSKNSQGGMYFLLHDGRAQSIDAAIQYHGGEAATSRAQYKALSEADKKALIRFLESL